MFAFVSAVRLVFGNLSANKSGEVLTGCCARVATHQPFYLFVRVASCQPIKFEFIPGILRLFVVFELRERNAKINRARSRFADEKRVGDGLFATGAAGEAECVTDFFAFWSISVSRHRI
jgi:hypothetical protein